MPAAEAAEDLTEARAAIALQLKQGNPGLDYDTGPTGMPEMIMGIRALCPLSRHF
eukprot:COSAG02_NODE_5347_length_4413_cov_2.948540_2_plen_55_part_00